MGRAARAGLVDDIYLRRVRQVRERVGAEGFVLVPVAGDKRPVDYGGGLRVGVEF